MFLLISRVPVFIAVPSPSQKSVGAGGNILLVEDYQALAIAFGTALKKFAGNYETRVVRSLIEAEGLLGELSPDLLVLDFDPPPRGSVGFFRRVKSSLPGARVLIVAAAPTPDFSAERSGPAAFHFIEKPFELDKFGAAIERLLGLNVESGHESSVGRLRDLGLTDMIMLYAVSGSNMVLKVEASGGRSGEIHFSDGGISHAAVMGRSGIEALQVILRWRSPRFSEAERTVDAPRTVHGAWAPILANALRAARASAAETLERLDEAQAPPPATPAAAGKRIVLIDDTELLSIFVEEILATAHPTFEIVTALSGLEGLNRTAAVKPDLILLDYSLPDITGGEVCRRLLENEETAAIPIVMMSGHVPEMTAAAERFHNVVATIAKPFLSSSLVDLVERTLTDLPKLAQRSRKKTAAIPPLVETTEPRVTEVKKSRNGRRTAPKPQPFATKPGKLALPAEEPIQAIETVGDLPTEDQAEANVQPESETVMPAAEVEAEVVTPPVTPVQVKDGAHTRATPIAPSKREEAAPKIEIPVAEAVAKPEPVPVVAPPAEPIKAEPASSISRASGLPASIKAAKLNAVILGLPLEVISIEFSPSLRIRKIRARPFSSVVSLHVLPQALSAAPFSDAMFELARVDLDAEAQFNLVLLAPSDAPSPKPAKYRSAIDGVIISPADYGNAVQLTPTAVAPMRMQLLALFELSSVELSANFRVAHLVLKSRGGRTRVTLFPEVAQNGATFDTAEVRVNSAAQVEEILLHAAAP